MDKILEPFQYIDAIKNLAPGAKFGIYGNDLTRIDWQDESISQPSDADIEAELVRLQAEYDANQYQRDRQYPQLGEQLDMLFHDMTAGKGDKTGEWYKAVAKVKADNPKPTE